MAADAMGQKAQAFARTFRGLANADVVKRTEAELVQRKAATTNFAGDFVESVMRQTTAIFYAKNADAVLGR